MIELYLNNIKADLSEDVTVPITYKFEDLSDPTKINNSYSKTVTLYSTKTNDKIFNYQHDIDYINVATSNTYYNINKKLPFEIWNNDKLFLTGYAVLDSMDTENGVTKFNLTLYGTKGQLIKGLKNDDGTYKYLDEVMNLTHQVNAENVVQGFQGISVLAGQDFLGYTPTYQGIYDNFQSNKYLLSDASTELDLGTDYDEYEVGALRSYEQVTWFKYKDFLTKLSNYDISVSSGILNSDYFKMLAIVGSNKKSSELGSPVVTNYNMQYNRGYQPYMYGSFYAPFALDMRSSPIIHPDTFYQRADIKCADSQTEGYGILSGNKLYLANSNSDIDIRMTGTFRLMTQQQQIDTISTLSKTYEFFPSDYYCAKVLMQLRNSENVYNLFNVYIISTNTPTSVRQQINNDEYGIVCEFDHFINNGRSRHTTSFSPNYNYWECNCITNNATTTNNGFSFDKTITITCDENELEFGYILDASATINHMSNFKMIDDSGNTVDSNTVLYANVERAGYVESLNLEFTPAAIRSNYMVSTKDICGDLTIYDTALDCIKMHGLILDTEDNTIKTKNEYFKDYEVKDWSDKIDLSKQYSLTNNNELAYLKMNYSEKSNSYLDYYYNKYKRYYASMQYRTPCETTSEYSEYESKFQIPFESEEFSRMLDVTKLDSSIVEYQISKTIGTSRSGDEEVQAFINNSKLSGFLREKNDVAHCLALAGNVIRGDVSALIVTDDTPHELLNNSYMHHRISAYSEEATEIQSVLPTFDYTASTIRVTDTSMMRRMIDESMSTYLGTPYEVWYDYGDTINTGTIFNRFLKKYYNDIYSSDGKILTAYFNLTPEDMINFSFKDFVYYKNQIWHPIEITDYDITQHQSTKVKLLKVNDIDNYVNGQFPNRVMFDYEIGTVTSTYPYNNYYQVADEDTSINIDVSSNVGVRYDIDNDSDWPLIKDVTDTSTGIHVDFLPYVSENDRRGTVKVYVPRFNADGSDRVLIGLDIEQRI